MKEFTVASFKFGLDTRKDVLTSQPGTLAVCENAHINPGGEVEKRKAFVEYANVLIGDTDGQIGTYGLEVTSGGLYVFGSAMVYGSTPTQGQPVLTAAMPAGITYRQLKHPALVNFPSENYNVARHLMQAVVFSLNYNGSDFVCARFSDGQYFLYYAGELVQHSQNGVVQLNLTSVANQSTELARQLAAIGWTAQANTDEAGAAENGSTIVTSPQGNYFTPLPSYESSSGRIGAKPVATDGAATSGARAVASFQITADSGTYLLEAPAQSTAGTPTVELCGGAVTSSGVIATTVAAIARAVNDLTSVHGYSAQATASSVFVYAPASWGNFTFNLTVTITTATLAAAGAGPTSIYGLITPSPLDVTREFSTPALKVVSGQVTAQASGGTAPYTYAWTESSSGSGNGIGISSALANKPTISFYYAFTLVASAPDQTRVGHFKLLITDNIGATVTLYITVTLRAIYKQGT